MTYEELHEKHFNTKYWIQRKFEALGLKVALDFEGKDHYYTPLRSAEIDIKMLSRDLFHIYCIEIRLIGLSGLLSQLTSPYSAEDGIQKIRELIRK